MCFAVTFADGSRFQNRIGEPSARLSFKNRTAELAAILFGHVGILDAYFAGSLDIEGELASMFRIGFETRYDRSSGALVKLRNRWHEWRLSNASVAQARTNARAHYGLDSDFYQQWLDYPSMMYTCAYWKDGTRDIEQAQFNKIEHVCRKIRLAPGESVVDIGCGFGGFMFHAAEHFGASVCGINITPEQVAYVQEETRRRRLQHLVEVREADFRSVHAQFDKVVSIGVLEHAGRDQLAEVVRAHADFLKPGGLGMLHFIGHVGERDTEFYIRKHIFPGGWIPGLARTITEMERCGLEILDIENLRRHYALTLDAWAERFQHNWPAVHELDPQRFDESFRRKWLTYLVSCAEMFRAPQQRTHLFQIVFSKGNVALYDYPMSRDFLYARPQPPARAAVSR
ncbi:MAG: cyclopropane-fatty-acyl-phospholipid synthase family protein [Gammaproteobacteria bacterium]|nr:cyclopropane-fatty-acyl-phospholipid synthase family protein [Gammaproteobacteria bacterium]